MFNYYKGEFMVNFVDAVKSVSINGRRRKLTGRKEQVVRRALYKHVPLAPVNKMKTELQINNSAIDNIKNTVLELKTKLDFCGEWAPWSKIGQQLSKK